mmetsp:Transcript_30060/g.80722  ORF Transcript_30060/g.80722 Transcript_30060/m.80722 type:complete len:207 (-) Transcript_30060:142-762(-)
MGERPCALGPWHAATTTPSCAPPRARSTPLASGATGAWGTRIRRTACGRLRSTSHTRPRLWMCRQAPPARTPSVPRGLFSSGGAPRARVRQPCTPRALPTCTAGASAPSPAATHPPSWPRTEPSSPGDPLPPTESWAMARQVPSRPPSPSLWTTSTARAWNRSHPATRSACCSCLHRTRSRPLSSNAFPTSAMAAMLLRRTPRSQP